VLRLGPAGLAPAQATQSRESVLDGRVLASECFRDHRAGQREYPAKSGRNPIGSSHMAASRSCISLRFQNQDEGCCNSGLAGSKAVRELYLSGRGLAWDLYYSRVY
jgi:hypothetical protein